MNKNNTVSNEQLEDVIIELIERLQHAKPPKISNNLSPSDIQDLAKTIAEKILASSDQPLNAASLKEPAFQKTLCLAVILEHANKMQPQLNLDSKFLFTTDMNYKQFENELTKQLTLMFQAYNQLHPQAQYDSKQIQEFISTYVNILTCQYKNDGALANSDVAANLMGALVDVVGLNLIALYGVDPRQEGAIGIVQYQAGNQAGLVLTGSAEPDFPNLMDKLNTYGPDPDPNGIEALLKGANIAQGIDPGGNLVNQQAPASNVFEQVLFGLTEAICDLGINVFNRPTNEPPNGH
jgi:hypothetical protein